MLALARYDSGCGIMKCVHFLGMGVMLLCAGAGHVSAQTNVRTLTTNAVGLEIPPGVTNVLVSFNGNPREIRADGLAPEDRVLVPGDRVSTGPRTEAALRFSDGSIMRVGENTVLEITAPLEASSSVWTTVRRGVLLFFHRGDPTDARIRTPTATAAVKGTEFHLQVLESGETLLTMIDGQVELSSTAGSTKLVSGEQGLVTQGELPRKSPSINVVNVIQWCLYYPAVVDVSELPGSESLQQELSESLTAYRAGDLRTALNRFPSGRTPLTPSGWVYLGALLLSVGNVEEAHAVLGRARSHSTTNAAGRLAEALELVIAAVKGESVGNRAEPQLATEWLAESYYLQSQRDLRGARHAARRAAEISPDFGFAWARLAELEFGFGNTRAASDALDHATKLSPRNAHALTIRGFVSLARKRPYDAWFNFDDALQIDNRLGDSWLGRGLCRIQFGQRAEAVNDLQSAVVAEPQRAILRSYLGKAFAEAKKDNLALNELELAKLFDPADPTTWLYSALVNQQQNRINTAVHDLEKSQELNDNRALFRSELLLDEDRAVRSANLARVYRDAGMPEVSLGEAAKAVTYDYTSDAAHLFISDSFNDLRDPTRFNLRYETVWFNEWLLANLLSPIGAGRLPLTVSQQEYTRLFERDGMGLASSTRYRSDGQIAQLASPFGTFGKTSWSLDLDYQHNDGVRVNNELDRLELYATIKQELTPHDTVLLIAKYQDYTSGDNFQYYDPEASTRPNFSFQETQSPILIGGYQHEWSPGVRTLLLGGRLENQQTFSDIAQPLYLVGEDASGQAVSVVFPTFDANVNTDLEIYTAEFSQLVQQQDRMRLVAGALWQGGEFGASDLIVSPSGFNLYDTPPAATSIVEPFNRVKGYGYLTFEPLDRVWLTGGLSYDVVEYPENFRSPPISAGQETSSLLGPKAALVWSPWDSITVRGQFTRSLGGVSLDESYRLEPTQLAGFPQAFRTVISESIVGSVASPEYETLGLALDLKPFESTYATVQFGYVESLVERAIGAFRLENGMFPPSAVVSSTLQNLDYKEKSLLVSGSQLLCRDWALGARYRFTLAALNSQIPEFAVADPSLADR